MPEHFTTGLCVNFINLPDANVTYYDSSHHGSLRADDVFTMVPAYSSQGGYGAYITSFAAINRNTDKPEEAFLLLDYLRGPFGAVRPPAGQGGDARAYGFGRNGRRCGHGGRGRLVDV